MTKTDLAQFPGDLHKRLMESTKIWQDIYQCCENFRLVLFYGPPGTGKSTVQCKHGLGKRNVSRQVLTAETTASKVLGQLWPQMTGEPVWIDGPVARSWRNGERLVIEEINEAGGDVIPLLHLAGDGRAIARITLPTGETITPHENFQMFASMNAEPSALPDALNDRFAIKRLVDTPDPRLLLSLPRCLRAAAAFSLFGEKNKEAALAPITTRQWVEIGQTMDLKGWSISETLENVFGPRGNAKAIAKAIEVRSAVDAINAAK